MLNLALAVGAAVLAALAVMAAGFSWAGAIVPALLVLLASYILLARRILKQVQALGEKAQKEIQAQRVQSGIRVLEQGFALARWQFLVDREIHANIGMLHYIQREFDKARPHLERSLKNNWVARAMLACLAFMEKDYARMEARFEEAVKSGKKEGLAWSAYAWCLLRLDRRDQALKVLARAVTANPTDDRLKANFTAIQNDRKLKMRAYTPMWFQFHLEKPAPEFAPGGRRVVFQRR